MGIILNKILSVIRNIDGYRDDREENVMLSECNEREHLRTPVRLLMPHYRAGILTSARVFERRIKNKFAQR